MNTRSLNQEAIGSQCMSVNETSVLVNLEKSIKGGNKIIYVIINDISGLYYKCLSIVIYDCNDIGLYYKTRDNRK